MFNRGDKVIYTITGETGKVYSDKKAPVYWVRFLRTTEAGPMQTVCVEISEKELTLVKEETCADIISVHPAG